jgi:hypothetical protein
MKQTFPEVTGRKISPLASDVEKKTHKRNSAPTYELEFSLGRQHKGESLIQPAPLW